MRTAIEYQRFDIISVRKFGRGKRIQTDDNVPHERVWEQANVTMGVLAAGDFAVALPFVNYKDWDYRLVAIEPAYNMGCLALVITCDSIMPGQYWMLYTDTPYDASGISRSDILKQLQMALEAQKKKQEEKT